MSVLRWWKKRIARALLTPEFNDALCFASLPVRTATPGEVTVHLLWVEGDLSRLEKLCCASYVQNGYAVKLWSYGRPSEIPVGVELCDARLVLPEVRIFRNSNGSVAGFSDLFRYTVLSRLGGLWSDIDVICMLPARDLAARLSDGFLVTEHTRDARQRQVNNNLIYVPAPKHGDIIDLALAVAERFDVARLSWGDCGPRLMTALAKTYPQLLPPVMEPSFANPLPVQRMPETVLAAGRRLPGDATFLHCYNERWRATGVDKNTPWPPESILGRLQAEYLPPLA